MDITTLTDVALAALLFGMERFCDDMYDSGYTTRLLETANNLYTSLITEYARRDLNVQQFSIPNS